MAVLLGSWFLVLVLNRTDPACSQVKMEIDETESAGLKMGVTTHAVLRECVGTLPPPHIVGRWHPLPDSGGWRRVVEQTDPCQFLGSASP